MNEFEKCRNDIEYFACNYIVINDPNIGPLKLVLNEFQRYVLKLYKQNPKTIVEGTGRRQGKTTIASVIILHNALFSQEKQTIAIFSRSISHSKEILSTIVNLYLNLPEFLRVNSMHQNVTNSLMFSNQSSIQALGSTFISSIVGKQFSFIYLDEYDFISNLNELISAIKTNVAQESKLLGLTTYLSRRLLL